MAECLSKVSQNNSNVSSPMNLSGTEIACNKRITLTKGLSMLLSAFLAKLFGLYMLIVAALWATQKQRVDLAIKDFLASRGLLLFVGVVNIIGGLAIAIGHPVWELNWRGLVTLLGYLMILQGIMRFAFYDKVKKGADLLTSKKVWVVIAIIAVLGAFLTYSGFTSM